MNSRDRARLTRRRKPNRPALDRFSRRAGRSLPEGAMRRFDEAGRRAPGFECRALARGELWVAEAENRDGKAKEGKGNLAWQPAPGGQSPHAPPGPKTCPLTVTAAPMPSQPGNRPLRSGNRDAADGPRRD